MEEHCNNKIRRLLRRHSSPTSLMANAFVAMIFAPSGFKYFVERLYGVNLQWHF
jgi:hypothetical protein